MLINGCDCSIVIKTAHIEKDIPYCDETVREAVSFLQEEASIEGDGICKGIRKGGGVTGCVVTPLTIGTAPLLLYLAMGSAGLPVFVSETRNLYKYALNLLPTEDTDVFDLIQDRKNERRLFEGCRVRGFELRILRGEAVKLKLDISGENTPRVYPYTDIAGRGAIGERFSSDYVTYTINGKDYGNIYGFTLLSKKTGGTRTELWIRRTAVSGKALGQGGEIPELIEEMTVTARLLRDSYEARHYGTFRITIKRLTFISDETELNACGTVIRPFRYYVAGTVSTEVYTAGEEIIP